MCLRQDSIFPAQKTSKAALSQSGRQLLEDVGVVSEKSEEQARRSSQDESLASLARGSDKQEAWQVARRAKQAAHLGAL